MGTRMLRLITLSTIALIAPIAPQSVRAQVATAADVLPVWEVTDGQGTVYLLGSIHLLHPDTYPLDDAIYAAFDEADVVAFEIDLEAATAAGPAMLSAGLFQDGRTLHDVLPADLYAELSAQLSKMGVPIVMVNGMQPWVIAITVAAGALQQAGYEGAHGIDMHFHERARTTGKETVALETVEEQLAVFSRLTDEEQVAFLRATLADLDSTVNMMDEATAMWQRGDAEAMAEMLTLSLDDQPNLRTRLLDDRNRSWVPHIESMLKTRQTTMVIVGMAHLVGPGSVVDLLSERGYSVTRVAAAPAH